MPEALQYVDNGLASLREESIVIASNEQ